MDREFLLNHEYLYLVFEFLFSFIVLSQADGGIGVTDEITDTYKKRLSGRNKPFITIPNGIEVSSVPVRSAPHLDPDQNISLVCVANFSAWHGIDRLILGLAQYPKKGLITLHLVGGGKEIPHLKQLCIQHNLTEHVIFHDFISGTDLDRLFDESHLAIGAIGIHRKKLSESSTLKSREYCSRGIPYVSACRDPDFPDTFPYIFRVPSDESIIDMEQVVMFASIMYTNSDHPQKMRKYAEEHLDWTIKMKKLKTFLEEKIIKK